MITLNLEKAKIYLNLLVSRLMEIEESRYRPSPIESKEVYLKRREASLKESLNHTLVQATRGYSVLLDELALNSQRDMNVFFVNTECFAEIDPKKPLVLSKAFGWSDEVLRIFYESANSLYNQERYSDAIDAYNFLVSVSPLIPELWTALAISFEAAQRNKEAEEAHLLALFLDPKNAKCINAAATFYRHQGRQEDAASLNPVSAVEDAKSGQSLNPESGLYGVKNGTA